MVFCAKVTNKILTKISSEISPCGTALVTSFHLVSLSAHAIVLTYIHLHLSILINIFSHGILSNVLLKSR